jgi:hypothetical protein
MGLRYIKYWMVYRGLGFLDVGWSVQVTEYRIIYRGLGFLRLILDYSPNSFTPLPSANCLSFSVFLCRRSSLLTGEGEGVGQEPNHTAAKKPKNTLWWRLWTFSLPCPPHMHLGEKKLLVALDVMPNLLGLPLHPCIIMTGFNSKTVIYIC